MTRPGQSPIPPPPADDHPPGCLCSNCFPLKVAPREYAAGVITGFGETLRRAMPVDAVLWILWVVNSHLRAPLSLDDLMQAVGFLPEDGHSMEGGLGVKGSRTKKSAFKGVQV